MQDPMNKKNLRSNQGMTFANKFYYIGFKITAWLLQRSYRVTINGIDNYLKANPRSLIVANHVSYLDGFLLMAILPGNLFLALNKNSREFSWLKRLLPTTKVYPWDPNNPMSIKPLIRMVSNNQRCLIFPEGRLTVTGGLMKIHEAPGVIATQAKADIIPIRIDGAQYSGFSRLKNKLPQRWFPKITIHILPARPFQDQRDTEHDDQRQAIDNKIYDLMTDLMFVSSDYKKHLFLSLLDAQKLYGKHKIILEDIQRRPVTFQQLILQIMITSDYFTKKTHSKEVIGIMLPTTIALFTIFFAGHVCGFVPAILNFTTGTSLILYACETVNIKQIITSRRFIEAFYLESLVDELRKHNITIHYLEDLQSKIGLHHKIVAIAKAKFANTLYRRRHPQSDPKDTAVILFTSGSEGKPKGVALSHENIQANRFQMLSRVDLSSQDVALNILPMFHAFGLTVGSMLSLSGVKTFLYPSPLHYRVIPEIAYDIGVSIFVGTDTFLSQYGQNAHPYDFYNVRYVFAGAERLRKETQQLWNKKFGIRIFEGYGTTEASPVISTNTPMHHKPGTVGRFLPRIRYKLEPVEGIDNGGRLFIKGPNLMKGYIHHDNPGIIVPLENQWYDTGDIVQVDEDNFITIKGRAKRFAKIGGETVSLPLIENFITSLWPDGMHAVVHVPDPERGEAIVCLTDYSKADYQAMAKFLKQQGLSNTYIPKQLFIVDKMFTLGSGKVDFVKARNYAIKKLS